MRAGRTKCERLRSVNRDLIAQAEADTAAGRVKPLDEVLGDG